MRMLAIRKPGISALGKWRRDVSRCIYQGQRDLA
jgi:hypothetical protein